MSPKLSAQSLKVRKDQADEAMRRRIFAKFCKTRGIPEPVAEHAFAAPDRKWRFDFAWVNNRVAVECHGGLFVRGAHSRGAHQLKDFEKWNAATDRGWRLFHVTPEQLCTEETIAMVRLAMR